MNTHDAHRESLHEAISILAGVCDYANERDRAGFSSADATIGHYLADVPADSWILEHLLTSQKLVRKYRRQLAGHPALGLVDHKFTPVADTVSDDDLDAVYDNAREVTRRGGELHRARARIAAGSSLLVDGATVSLTFPYDEELIAESRIIAGRTYDPDTKSNRYPITSLSAVIAFSDRHGITVDDEIRTLATAVDADPRAYAKPNVTVDGSIFTIDCPFVDGLASALRTLNGNKTTWDGATRTHRLPLTCDRDALAALLERFDLIADAAAESLLGVAATEPHIVLDGAALLISHTSGIREAIYELRGSLKLQDVDGALRIGLHVAPEALRDLFAATGLRLGDGVAEALDTEIATQARNRASATARKGTPFAVPGLGVELMTHQYPAVQYIIDHRRVVLADDMGLGKTITALAAVAATATLPLVVACKADLVPNWRTEIERALPGRRIYHAQGMTGRDKDTGAQTVIPTDAEIVIISFNVLAALDPANTTPGADRFVWVKKILEWNPHAFIVDEGHLGKEKSAARSRAMVAVGRAVAQTDGVVLDLTGTPLVNRPNELAQQLVMLGVLAADGEKATRAHLFGEFGGFLFRYCGPVKNNQGTTFKGHSNTGELHNRLLNWGVFIRRDESALDLPSFTMRKVELDPALIDHPMLDQYRSAADTMINTINERTHETAHARGMKPTPELTRSVIASSKAEHLVELNLMRRYLGLAKIPAITAWVADQIASGEKVMISAHHIEVVGKYADTFGGLTIRGGQSATGKNAHKHRFQNNSIEQAPAITVSIGAGGVGHTLTAARIGVQAELCWTPGELKQMAKRIHRIGQTRPVEYIVPVVPGTNDEMMWDMLVDKQRVLDAVIDGADIDTKVDIDTDDEDAAVEVAWMMSMRALANASAPTSVESATGDTACLS
ncbi:DEAD/DEAH box helicase [Rhodococcus qingshengii]|uniref:DEAD/DEAH box helicase n=1 Tax=Rhodococcus qingshengii TaxID=334542 RepID=UPI00287F6B1A|nr:DEAD/DEAH box helicase [Rhodococcus qingshengii]